MFVFINISHKLLYIMKKKKQQPMENRKILKKSNVSFKSILKISNEHFSYLKLN